MTPEVVRAWTRCGINQPSVDHLTRDDDRLEALTWSFVPGSQDAPDGACAGAGDDGRLLAVPCGRGARAFTCLGPSGIAVTTGRGPWQAGGDTCAAAGLGSFATPRTGREAAELDVRVPDDTDVWVSLRRADGAWRLGCVPGRAGGPLRVDTRPPASCPA